MARKIAGELYESISEQLFEIGRQLRQPSGYPFDPQILKKYLQNVIEGKFDCAVSAFVVTVNYDLSVEAAVKAGKYDWSDDDITSRNSRSNHKGTADVEITLVHFNRFTKSDEVIRELDKQNLRPAELLELLAFGAKYPELQRDFPIVGLNSVWQDPDGGRRCAYLYGGGSGRNLCLDWFDVKWGIFCRFAAVRNLKH